MDRITQLFPLLAIAAGVAAYLAPGVFSPYAWAIVPLLVVIMFAMGLTLTIDDFRRVARQPAAVGLGVLLQYTIMPAAAVLVGFALSLSPELLDQYVPVDIVGMLGSMVEIVLLPVMLGVGVNHLLGHRLERIKPLLPVVAIAAILLAIAVIVALNRPQLAEAALTIVAAVVLHNLIGFAAGYLVPRGLGFDRLTCRTLSIEVGMQNSGLSVALALKFFAPLAALPGAIFSIWHNIGGAVLAGYWASRPVESPGEAARSEM